MKTLDSPFSQVAWHDKTYIRKENGTIEVPDDAVKELTDIGCKPMSARPQIEIETTEASLSKDKQKHR